MFIWSSHFLFYFVSFSLVSRFCSPSCLCLLSPPFLIDDEFHLLLVCFPLLVDLSQCFSLCKLSVALCLFPNMVSLYLCLTPSGRDFHSLPSGVVCCFVGNISFGLLFYGNSLFLPGPPATFIHSCIALPASVTTLS